MEWTARTYLRFSLIAAGCILIASYAYYEARPLLLGPSLSVETPLTGETVSNSLVTIQGRAERISHLYLNDRKIFTDKEGRFSEQLLLPYGYSILTLNAQDRFGRSITKTLELVYN